MFCIIDQFIDWYDVVMWISFACILWPTYFFGQETVHKMRLVTNDLFHIGDQLAIIQSCKSIPDIYVPSSTSSDATTLSP